MAFPSLRHLDPRTRNQAWAEDLFQETWLRVVERGSQYDARWRFQSWLLAIARNLAIDHARRRQPLSLEDSASAAEGESGISLLDRLPNSDSDPFQQAAGRDEQDRLADVLGHLPTHYREVLTMRFHEELRLDEIAHVTGAPLSTVKSRLLPTCPACNQAVSLADQFCTQCGAPVRAGERMASGT
ncbi:MAG TPA: sigma-70 family RNA polymerase sigma factor [Pirellulaceae bacterium]|nr:sigma-70 family RNA polymerase sigma factor [Pirellulaceae bacterium]